MSATFPTLKKKNNLIHILYKNGKPANCHGRLHGQYCERRWSSLQPAPDAKLCLISQWEWHLWLFCRHKISAATFALTSLSVILKLTQARCITIGIERQWAFGLKSVPRATTIPQLIMSLLIFLFFWGINSQKRSKEVKIIDIHFIATHLNWI